MRKIIQVAGIIAIAVIAIAWSGPVPQLTTKTEVPAVSPYEMMLQQADNLPFQYWDEPF